MLLLQEYVGRKLFYSILQRMTIKRAMTTTPGILRWYIGESVTNMQVVEERLIAVAKGYIEGLHPRYTAQWPLMGGSL